jgi:hypothetical protein
LTPAGNGQRPGSSPNAAVESVASVIAHQQIESESLVNSLWAVC